MTAETLRRAADLLEKRAATATSGSWPTPAMATPLAAWLRVEADGLDGIVSSWHPGWGDAITAVITMGHGHAIELAEAILGETS